LFQTLHQIMPHFAERDEKTNSFKQQDAHECWSAILSSLGQTLESSSPSASEQQVCYSVNAVTSFHLSLSLSLSLMLVCRKLVGGLNLWSSILVG
jgi:hypothetical protein